MDNQQGKTYAAIWLSAFIVGEGSLQLRPQKRGGKTYFYPVVKLANTDYVLLDVVTKMYTELGVPYHVSHRTPDNPRWKKSWSVETSGFKRVLRLIDTLYPHLYGTKKTEADTILRFWEIRSKSDKGTPYSEEEKALIDSLRNRLA